MTEIQGNLDQLDKNVTEGCKQLKVFEKQQQLLRLQKQSAETDFWSDSTQAQAIMKQQAILESQVLPWLEMTKSIEEMQELVKLGDASLGAEISRALTKLQAKYAGLKSELAYSGPYDNHNVILSVYAGAGGTDAQDWAQMLLRMYTRWAETQGAKLRLLDQSSGDEAGIKSATLEICLPQVYGKLKGEHGVHRLVRLSPFNSDNLRQTSFAKIDIIPKIDNPTEIKLDDKDLKIDVYRAGGHGGQSVNTTDSAVRITHLPTGITVSIQNERSQLQNKETALTILRSRLARLQLEQHKEQLSELKGPTKAVEWGSQIRSYVLHPYKQVKDLRTKHESSDPDSVLDGGIDEFITAYGEYNLGSQA